MANWSRSNITSDSGISAFNWSTVLRAKTSSSVNGRCTCAGGCGGGCGGGAGGGGGVVATGGGVGGGGAGGGVFREQPFTVTAIRSTIAGNHTQRRRSIGEFSCLRDFSECGSSLAPA